MGTNFEDNYLWSYFRELRWDEAKQFSYLCHESKEILDFQLPDGLQLGIGSFINPQFQKSIFFGLNGKVNLAFLFSSIPVNIHEPYILHFSEDLAREARSIEQQRLEEAKLIPTDLKTFKRSFVLYGRLCEKGKVESCYLHHWTKRLMTIYSSSTYLKKPSHANFQVLYEGNKSATEFIVSSQEKLVGLRSIYHYDIHSKRFSLGGEMYYAFKEGNPGVSIGLKYQNLKKRKGSPNVEFFPGEYPQTSSTFTFNPIFGHTSVAYTTQVWNNLTLSTRYDYNIHSLVSSFAVGFESRNQGEVIKGSYDTDKGFSLLVEIGYFRTIIGIGFLAANNQKVSFGLYVNYLAK